MSCTSLVSTRANLPVEEYAEQAANGSGGRGYRANKKKPYWN